MFIAPAPKRIAIQGTTYSTPAYTLGSVNRSEFWVQRRPLLAYWNNAAGRPAHFQLRFVKDDYDFSSAMLYSVQSKSCVLGAVNFISPGGDKHLSLDPVRDGAFAAREFYLEWLFAGDTFRTSASDVSEPLIVESHNRKWRIRIAQARFGEWTPRWRTVESKNGLSVRLDLIPPNEPRTVEWKAISEGSVVFTLEAEPGQQAKPCEIAEDPQAITAKWTTPHGTLELRAGRRVVAMPEQDALFANRIDGRAVPLVRLSEERLA
ncbi:MAG: hypothetical protein JNL98_20710 [Bryobacterales bacterium]|nr:hypothetical protein [Bryobacterales bacterium]